MNTNSKNKPQQKHHLGAVCNKLLGGLNRFYVDTTLVAGSAVVKNIQFINAEKLCILENCTIIVYSLETFARLFMLYMFPNVSSLPLGRGL